MKGNVDLTEKGHFSHGWMQGGWMAKGVFRKRKPIETSKKFKKILKMGNKKKKYIVSSLVSKLFGLRAMSQIVVSGTDLTFSGVQYNTTNDWSLATTASTAAVTWIPTNIT